MAYWPPFTADTATATCWLAVSDATVENGCMRFVPESHKEAELRHHAPGGIAARASKLWQQTSMISESKAVRCNARMMAVAASPASPCGKFCATQVLQHV